MGRWSDEAKVGLLVLSSLILLIFLLFSSATWRVSRGGQKVRVHFRNVGALTIKAPVHLSGVKVGEVTKIELMDDKVEVSLELKSKVALRRGTRAKISTLGLVGETYVDVRNGPLENPKLLVNEVLEGVDSIDATDMLNKVNQFLTLSTETLNSVQKFVKSNESELQAVASGLKNAISELSGSAQQTLSDVDRLTHLLNEAVKENDRMLNRTLTKFNLILDKVNLDSEEFGERLREILTELNDFMQKNRGKTEAVLDQLSKISNSLYATSTQLNSDLKQLNLTASNLLNRLDQLSQSETPKIQEGLSRFVSTSKSTEELIGDLKQIVAKIEAENSNIGRLINDKSLIENVDRTIDQAQFTITEIGKLSQNLNQDLAKFSQISPSVDYELRYRSGVRNQDHFRGLHNEFGVSILPTNRSKLRLGLSSRESQIDYELQAALAFALGRLWARAGLIRSKAGAGLDYWLIKDRFGLSLEAVGITATKTHKSPEIDSPEIDFEALFKANAHWNLIIGAEDIADKIGFTMGVRATY